jgi:predicted RNase H-like HicB family nuclease
MDTPKAGSNGPAFFPHAYTIIHLNRKQKGRWFLAKIPELDFVAQGQTLDEAKANLF